MMALPASDHSAGSAAFAIPSRRWENFSAGSGSPITPVEARKTSLVEQPTALAAASAVKAVVSRPFFPVKAFAFPELTTSTRAEPPGRFWRQKSTGADGHCERV